MTNASRFRIRLPHWRWFLLSTVVLVIGFVGLSVWLPWHREQQIIRKIESSRGEFETGTNAPEWMQRLLGEERMSRLKLFDRIISVDLGSTNGITDAEIALL